METLFPAYLACIGQLPAHSWLILSSLSSYRSQHQDVTIFAERAGWAAALKR